MEKRRKEAVRRHKTREKSPFPFHIPAPCWCEGSWMLRVPPPASVAPPGKSWVLLALSLPSLGSVPHQWAQGGVKVVPRPLRGRYLEPVRILLTSGSPDEHNRGNIHQICALQPTLVIPARCPHRVCASQSLGEANNRGKYRNISSFNPPKRSLSSSHPAPRGAAGSPALNSSHCIPCTPCPLPGTACPAV